MSEERGPLSSLKKWLNNNKNGSSGNQKLGKHHYILIALIIGIAFMLMSKFLSGNQQSTDPMPVNSTNDAVEDVETLGKNSGSQPSSMMDYEVYYENQLKDPLEAIVGVDDVSIVVNVEATEKQIYEKNKINHKQTTEETDANGGKRKVEDDSTEEQMVLIREGDKEIPLISETKKPEIQGVLIVAKGADNLQVKKSIIEAVTRVLDVSSHRVSVQVKK
ncbi:stage III sporulation protein AG [Caldibacillus lycopersici]|uniref:Stage III sporulation protein AG n=1 Tax=Perspicuibacillus lycopersici TaxID=1325689 RepID=A0AAE3ISZ4_9BACI|nr:stage III sporulation protein AG [Perspicuibacillus lycopersici]MCU9613837.1 stage III sporulation protein AG [Perspicuibacillus lycopersici]